MTQITETATISATRGSFVADTHGARYQTAAEGQPESREASDRHGRIVVGIDGSEASVAALRRAVVIATALHTTVVGVASWSYLSGYTSVTGGGYSPLDDATAILSGASKSVFGAAAPEWFTAVAFEGDAADVLIEQSEGAEMLIVGSRGHSGLAGVLLGSVSARCAERAHCPVLVMH